jgi:hypothetical protein
MYNSLFHFLRALKREKERSRLRRNLTWSFLLLDGSGRLRLPGDAAKFVLYAENNFMIENGEISILAMT